MLEQAENCSIRRLDKAEAFRRIYDMGAYPRCCGRDILLSQKLYDLVAPVYGFSYIYDYGESGWVGFDNRILCIL